MFDDLDPPRKKKSFEIGQNLDDLSVTELDETIDLLKEEITRLEGNRAKKQASQEEAASIFKS